MGRNSEAAAVRRNLFFSVRNLQEFCCPEIPGEAKKFTLSQFRVMNRVYRWTRDQKQGISLKILARVLEVTPAAASEMVETLVRKEVLVRSENPNDRRSVYIILAPDWEQRFQTCERILDQVMGEYLDALPAERRASAVETFAGLADFIARKTGAEEKDDD